MRVLFVVLMLMAPGWASAQNWQPSDRQKAAVLGMVEAYFIAIDARKYRQAYDLYAPSFRASHGYDKFLGTREKLDRMFGRVTSRKVLGVSWYPKSSREGTGVAAAIDFEGTAENADFACGYIAMIELREGEFRLIRDDTTFVDAAILAGMERAQQIELLNRPGCRQFLPR